MKFLTKALQIVAIAAFISLGAQPVQAQLPDTGGADTGTADNAIGAGTGSGALSTEVDTSAFEAIERGDTVGDTAASGFGLAFEDGGGAGARTGVGGIGGGGLGAFGGLGGLSNLFGGFGQGQGAAKPIIRTRIRSAVKVAPVAPALVQRDASVRLLNQSDPDRQLGGVNVQMVGRRAVLTGTVGNESDRRMSELLLRLEPGVSSVENRVVVLP